MQKVKRFFYVFVTMIAPTLLVLASIMSAVASTTMALKFAGLIDGTTIRVSAPGTIAQSAHKEFDWRVYFDPKNPEFWDDGNGEPPRPYRHVAARPTVENINKLREWTGLQEAKIAEVTAAMGKGLIKEQEKSITDVKALLSQNSDSRPSDDLSQIDIVYIFNTSCTACREAKPVLERLRSEGAQITSLQADYEGGLEPSALPYSKEYRDLFPSQVTPTFYIKVGNFSAARIEGFRPYGELMAALTQHIDKEIKKKS